MRKTKIITIPGVQLDEPGHRDNGKVFILTEMASRPAEKWADRAFLALAHSDLDIPPLNKWQKMAWIEQVQRAVGHIKFPEIEPLMDEIMRCVQRDEGNGFTRALIDNGGEGDDIEEVATRHFLRSEVIGLHANFSLPAAMLTWIAAGSTMTAITETSTTTPISPKPSAQSSRRSSPRFTN